MYLSLRIKILFLLFVLITGLALVFSESAARLIREKTEETFQNRVSGLLVGVRRAWEAEQNHLLRNATLYAESDKLITYVIYGLNKLLHKEIRRLLTGAQASDLLLHLRSGLIFSGIAEVPTRGVPLDVSDTRLNLSQVRIIGQERSLEMNAEVPVHKLGEFIGLLTLRRRVEDATLREMARLLQVDLSLTVRGNLLASTLPPIPRRDLLVYLYRNPETGARSVSINLDGQRHLAAVIDLGETAAHEPILMYCTISQEQLLSLIESARAQNWQLTLVALTISFFFAFLFAERVLTSRIRRIRDGSALVAQGNLSTRLEDKTRDEIGELAQSFNDMAGNLAGSRDRLLQQNEELQTWVKKLEHMQAYINDILGSLATGVLTWSREGRTVTANPAARRELVEFFPGHETLEGINLKEFLRPLSRKSRRVFTRSMRALQTDQSGGMPFDLEFDRGLHRGTKVMQGNFSYQRDAAGATYGVILTLEDITQRRIIEQQLYHADKLSSVGQLAASVAHEIKNPLASIKTLGQLLQEETPEKDSRREYIDVIVSEVNRLNGVVEQLLRFARPEGSSFSRVKLKEILTPVEALLHHESERNRIELAFEYPPDLELHVDAEKLKQVFLNLIFNAIQSMPSGRGGKVKTRAFHDPSSPWIICEVEDNGNGMPAEVVARVFDPFYTTKQRGTGLGLAIVQKIVDLHGGKIEVRSQPDVGTTFTVQLPLDRKEH